MKITDIVTDEYTHVTPDTRVAKLRGTFDSDRTLPAILVVDHGEYDGLVTRSQLLSSHHAPNEQASTITRSAPKVRLHEDVRETARLMVENDLKLLPVFEGDSLVGVVTARDLLTAVRDNLGALDVEDVFTRDVVSVTPDTTIGEVIHTIRTHRFTRVPVLDADEPVGMVSIYDLIDFTTRAMQREQGGSAGGFDQHAGNGSSENYNTHGGFGERVGSAARMLELPARDVMNTPAVTVDPDAGLDEAFATMHEHEFESLIVPTPAQNPGVGIVTTTDLLRSLTWTPGHQMPVQVFGVDLLDDLRREAISSRIEAIDGKYERMDVLEANVDFQKHKEKQRGTPLLRATVRLVTSQGLFTASGEGYGASSSFNDAADVVEQNVLANKQRTDPKTIAQQERDRAAALLGWWSPEEQDLQ
jgi:CBS domain-containing protein